MNGIPVSKEDMENQSIRRMYILAMLVLHGAHKFIGRPSAIESVVKQSTMFKITETEVESVLDSKLGDILCTS